MDAAGTATTPSIVIASSTRATAFRVAIGVAGATGAGPVCAARRVASRPRSTRVPTRLSRAGVSVIAMSTAIATHAAPTVPMRPRNGMPVTLSARSAMIDRGPGEHHRVAGRAGREGDGLPDRVAVHELAAVAVDDEQRVVDPDREAEHHAQGRRHGRHLDDARERHRPEHADPDAEERRDDRAGRPRSACRA